VDPIGVEAIRVLARLARVLERGCSEISLAHYRVLATIASGDESASRVARKLALGKPTVSATVESLCARGLVVRSDVDTDQRAAALSVTPTGRAMLDREGQAMLDRLLDVCRRVPDGVGLIEKLAQLDPAITASLDDAPLPSSDEVGPTALPPDRDKSPTRDGRTRRGATG
jgi:DNA-binding MarR family transcriptional regulator